MTKFENFDTSQSEITLPSSIKLQPSRESFYTIYGKRMFDIVFALTLLPILFLFFVGLSILNFRYGKTLFAQERIGKNGKAYKCLKFRTMVIDAEQRLIEYCKKNPDAAKEWEVFQKLSNDPRITPLGKVLRKTRLDELPQLINILRGEMSFVGPRPFTVDQKEIYDSKNKAAYYTVRPGVTGLWQLKQDIYPTFQDRVHLDVQYTEDMSFTGDLLMILQTSLLPLKLNGK